MVALAFEYHVQIKRTLQQRGVASTVCTCAEHRRHNGGAWPQQGGDQGKFATHMKKINILLGFLKFKLAIRSVPSYIVAFNGCT